MVLKKEPVLFDSISSCLSFYFFGTTQYQTFFKKLALALAATNFPSLVDCVSNHFIIF